MQLHHGIARSIYPDRETDNVRRVIAGINVYAVTYDIAARAGEIDGDLTARGVPIGLTDTLIAATALHHGEPVVTRNVRHFERVPGVEVRPY